ncbi:GDSL-type esterase/lipase family protein [uncultured Gemmiger sp.]|uniref:GDSL-type esterase/lipase family protein n=1 Tax=uncultured Gemmiger sp. TaxID=1623490 RepID=UPI0025E4DE6E|nr:GDSL-type esterase/lipase family protein [uncultured Gemmiger sp.]
MANTTHRRPPQRSARRYDALAKAYMVLAGCAAVLLATTIAAFLLVLDVADTKSGKSLGSLVQESGYDSTKNAIDQSAFSATVLPETEDAGQEYIDSTLFLGDSNTARMYRMFDYCSYDNAIGSVGMSARSLQNFACVKFSGYGSYVTMPQAVALMQPRRVLVTFGTNDLSPNYSADSFIENYRAGLQAIADAYPTADIIVNAIPPLGRSHSNANLTQSQVDEYNKAIVEMCDANGWKFLNSAEVLKDDATGYAKDGYVESGDGIHLTRAAMEALFGYIRTHSYITEDTRPTVTDVPRHVEDKDAVTYSTPVLEEPAAATPAETEEPDSEESTESEETEPTPTPTATPTATPTPTPTPTEPPAPTPDQEATPTPTPAPEAAPSPTPTPAANSEAAPTPTPESTPEPAAAPPADTEPAAADTPQA